MQLRARAEADGDETNRSGDNKEEEQQDKLLDVALASSAAARRFQTAASTLALLHRNLNRTGPAVGALAVLRHQLGQAGQLCQAGHAGGLLPLFRRHDG